MIVCLFVQVMSAGCARWLLSRAARAVCRGGLVFWTPTSRLPICRGGQNVIPATWGRPSFSAEADDVVKETPASKKKKQDPRAPASISNVGRKIPHREVQVLSDTGEDLGVMHRGKVIRLMDEKTLKLVLLSEHKDPPLYQLMSGKQIHEEQMKLWEKHKAKAGGSSRSPDHDLTLRKKL